MIRGALIRSAGAIALAAVLLYAATAVPESRVVLFNTFLAYGALTLSLDLMVGDLNLLPAGHAAFFGVGGYTSVVLCQHAHWSLLWAGLAAVIVTAAIAVIVGLPAVGRTTGFSFAIVTFAVGELFIQIVDKFPGVFGGSEGITVNWGVGSKMPFGYSIYRFFSLGLVGAFLVTLLVVIWVRRTHLGLRFAAVRADENGTRGLGFNPVFYKTIGFVIASALAGLVGVFWAPMVGYISPDSMGVDQSILLLSLLIVGGTRRVSGAIAGVLLLLILPQYLDLSPDARIALVGGALAVISLAEPRGLAGLVVRLRKLVRRAPHDETVPAAVVSDDARVPVASVASGAEEDR